MEAKMDRKDELYLKNAKRVEFKEDGTMVAHVPITSVGVYVYKLDGTAELRSPEEVFKKESLDTLIGKPVTLHHPPKLLTKMDYANGYVVGKILGNVNTDGYRVYADLHITDKKAISAALANGCKYLSAGYGCKTYKQDGVWMGSKYDTVQQSIVYDHVALVSSPRGDENLKMRFDCQDELLDQIQEKTDSTSNNGDDMSDTTQTSTTSGSTDYIKLFGEMQAKMDGKDKEIAALKAEAVQIADKAKGERDAIQSKMDSLEAELKKLKEGMPAAIHEAASKLTALHAKAKELGVEVKLDSTEQEIKVAVLKHFNKDFDPANKSADYITARFDSAIELGELKLKEDAEKRKESKQAPTVTETKLDAADKTPDAARARMIASFGKQVKAEA